MDFLKDIKKRVDIIDVAGRYLDLKRRGRDYIAECPFHKEETPSFLIKPGLGTYHCLGCGKSGDVIGFYSEIEGISYLGAAKVLADEAGMVPFFVKPSKTKEQLYTIYRLAAAYFINELKKPEGETAAEYIGNRKLSEKTVKKFGLGFAPAKNSKLYTMLKSNGFSDELIELSALFTNTSYGIRDKFWNRVMFPIADVNGKVIAFGGRVMGEGSPKYLNSNETLIFDKSRNLYGLYLAKNTKRNYFILCEGYMDVIALHQAGFDNAVASLGTSLTSGQANRIAEFTKNVMISYDGDEAGVKAALRAIPILKGAGLTVKLLNMDPYKDPDELIKALGADEYKKRIMSSVSDVTYQASHLEESSSERADFIKDIAELMLKA